MGCCHADFAMVEGSDRGFTLGMPTFTFGAGVLAEAGENARELGLKRVALFTDRQVLGDNNSGQLVIRDDFLKKNPKTSEILVTGIGKAIEWARVTPREQVIDRFTKIIEQRGRNESTANLKFWKSVSVPARGGLISDADFKTWEPWLLDSGAISGPLDITTLYTNEFNDYRDGRTPAGAPGGTA